MHRPIIRSALLLALCAPALLAQKKVKEVKPGDVELKRLEDQWAAALPRRDRAYFDKYLAPKFIYTENDKMVRRDQMLRDLISGPDSVTAARNEDMEVHQFGATTAVVTGWLIVDGKTGTSAFTHRYRFTDTWVKRKAGWQIVAAQDYLVPK
ncbi:MAG TPA: nuclear transport factor 2 family protein [Gemmatimonadaceae bacterium]